MNPNEPLIRNVSDTARWVAYYRAQETARKDALFRDPLAEKLAGERGRAIAESMPRGESWPFITRTVEFDGAIRRAIASGADAVINLAAGFDTRPYRLELPATLRWFELDLPEILEEKARLLESEKPRCEVERLAIDLSDNEARRAALTKIGNAVKNAIVLSEGLIGYLTDANVAALSAELAAIPAMRTWVIDLMNPQLLKMVKRSFAKAQVEGVELRFAPESGVNFFEVQGWRVESARSLLKVAARLGRVNFLMRLIALFPDAHGQPTRRPWGGVCVLKNALADRH